MSESDNHVAQAGNFFLGLIIAVAVFLAVVAVKLVKLAVLRYKARKARNTPILFEVPQPPAV